MINLKKKKFLPVPGIPVPRFHGTLQSLKVYTSGQKRLFFNGYMWDGINDSSRFKFICAADDSGLVSNFQIGSLVNWNLKREGNI